MERLLVTRRVRGFPPVRQKKGERTGHGIFLAINAPVRLRKELRSSFARITLQAVVWSV